MLAAPCSWSKTRLTSQYATSNASDHAASKKHADVSCACAYRTTDDKNDAPKLYGPLSAVGIC